MILITGATGNVGREVVNELRKSETPFKIVSHRKDSEYVYFDFENADSFRPALTGVKKLFLLRPPHIADAKKYFQPLIDIAKEVGVEHIVFLSLLGVEKNPIVPHHKIEKIIKKSGIPYTFLRPSFFMQNLISQHGEELRKEKEIYVPAGKGKTSFIDVRDIGTVTARILTENGHENKGYSLTGTEALDYYEVAEILSEELGETIKYVNPSVLQFRDKMLTKGIQKEFVTVMIGIYFTAKIGLAKKITPDLQILLGKRPITFKEFAHDYKYELV
ncbi:SDR family oxidoreductase [Paenibacillus sp. FSL R7-0189]|uniref:SDR family oxidoreductase n=1 Tax=Paenibacillus sp. FSL R7-0189 TaxID=2921673 RepID=UPI0030D7170F